MDVVIGSSIKPEAYDEALTLSLDVDAMQLDSSSPSQTTSLVDLTDDILRLIALIILYMSG